ncbi:exodeoxyribonuclease III [Pseudonocardia pini]|uniref:exodeoxyribonuclease III n=1 Tax=Pseudonocardia pini TaxID=2758030 RepID=UPI0028A79C82|nr:exodeoxyribonuclease III [Pseudonocardia pini]
MTPVTVGTANVNGIRAASTKGFLEWLAGTSADVVCLQEVRALAVELPREFLAATAGLHLTLDPASAKGRNGVAILSREAPLAVRTGIGAAEFAGHGRYVEVDLPGLTVASLYLPKGQAGTPKQEEKDRFLAALAEHLGKTVADGREMVVAGDFNIAPAEADIRAWRNNLAHSGFLPHERAWLADLCASGWQDTVRALHPGVDGPYTWWSYRGRAFDNDAGWRIDHVLATPGLAPVEARVERASSYDSRWSDHAPVTVRFGS